MPAVLLLTGAALTLAGVAWLCIPATLIVAGVMLLLAGIDLRR